VGTATLFHEQCSTAVYEAIKLGYRQLDTALLYNNQEAVGQGIARALADGLCTRSELFVTSKVAFYPTAADGSNCFSPISFHPENVKSLEATRSAIQLCLSKLQLSYVDLMLIHNPLTQLDEYQASAAPHCFELGGSGLSSEERALVLQHRLSKVQLDEAAGESARAAAWKALEEAQAAGQCKFIGVSNYPARLIEAMDKYAAVAPAVNQIEFHPRFSSPSLRAVAASRGLVLTAYGSGNSTRLSKSPVVAAMAERLGLQPLAVVLQWTLQHGVVVIPRTANVQHMAENAAVATAGAQLSAEDMAALDALNEAHPYYWWPLPSLPPGSKPDL
jgi:D-xylose reductase